MSPSLIHHTLLIRAYQYQQKVSRFAVWRRWFLLTSMLGITACGIGGPAPSTTRTSVVPSPSATVYFPQQDPARLEQGRMAALLSGSFVNDTNCLRVNTDIGGTSYLIAWPPDVSLHVENNLVEIRNGDGQVVAREGERVRFGGGEVQGSRLAGLLRKPLSNQCPGPYWLVGDILAPTPPSS